MRQQRTGDENQDADQHGPGEERPVVLLGRGGEVETELHRFALKLRRCVHHPTGQGIETVRDEIFAGLVE